MYVPRPNAMHPDEVHRFVEEVGSAELITVGPDACPMATRLPVIWVGDRLVFHMAIANPHWRSIEEGAMALAVVTGPEAYVSPSWYPSKAEHHRVVPTWNYSAVHVTGRATIHRDPGWLRAAVGDLTELHEAGRDQPWAVTDAPEAFVAQQLKAIVGIELEITAVEAKAKRSQNRSEADRVGVIDGLMAQGDERGHRVARQMQRDLDSGQGA